MYSKSLKNEAKKKKRLYIYIWTYIHICDIYAYRYIFFCINAFCINSKVSFKNI